MAASASAGAGRTFENIFQDHQELYGDDYRQRTIIPGLLEYFRDPSAANARALLTTLRIPLPYSQLNATPSAPGRRPSASGAPGRSGGAPPVPTAPPEFFEVHKRIDFLHDILGERIYPDVAERVLRGAPVTPEVNARIREAIQKNNATFRDRERGNPANAMLTAIAEELSGISRMRFQLASPPTPTPQAMLSDAYLVSLLQNWMSRPVLEIVLDGLFAARIPPPSERDQLSAVNQSKVARSLCVCAFLQLALCDWKPTAAATVAVTRVAFLTGDFQTLENPGAEAFTERWVRRIRSETAAFAHLSPDQISARRVVPKDLPSLGATPFRSVTLGRAGLTVAVGDRAAISVPYRAPAASPASAVSPVSRAELSTSYKKDWLSDVFSEYLIAPPERRKSPEWSDFIDALITVNAFRDAFKAEVALARGAVFITVDALALVYHQARAGAAGGGLMILPTGFEMLTMKYYVPVSATASRSRPSAQRASRAAAGI